MGRKSGEELGLSYCHGLGGNQVRMQIKICSFVFPTVTTLYLLCCLYVEHAQGSTATAFNSRSQKCQWDGMTFELCSAKVMVL